MPKKILLEFEKPIAELYAKIAELELLSKEQNIDMSGEINTMKKRAAELEAKVLQNLTPMQIVQISRHQLRPTTLDYIQQLFSDFVELKGDRTFADDPAIVGGFAFFQQQSVMLIGHQNGHDTKENIYRNFGMPNPEGYRKALRLMRLAEKYGFPIITFIDTPGAYPGLGAEERGQAEAIAANLLAMSGLKVPVLSIVTGEGGSGGALGIAVANKVLMLEYAVYSVISPEACGSILWRDSSRAGLAASALQLTAPKLLELKIIDGIIPEPGGGAHNDYPAAAANVGRTIEQFLQEYSQKKPEALIAERYHKYRNMGFFK